ncbi:MAG: CoA transferase [Sphingomonadaceae bacterium]|nr:CoA transferase [Sphingomonadaceae bacterium]
MSSVRPLAGLKVLDLAWVVAGPMIGRVLADAGATVIRIESSQRIETARIMGPFPNGDFDPQRSASYENCNAGKLGMTLDLSSSEGRDVALDLARWADVLVESFAPGQMAKWGLGYDVLSESNPRLIMVSTSLMGQSGPLSKLAGFGNVGAALSGYKSLVGFPDGELIGPFGPYTDYVGPRYATAALLAALAERDRTGDGAWLDISQVEAGIQFLGAEFADYFASGRVAVATGNRVDDMAPHGVFPAAGEDRWVAIAVRSDAEWSRLAAMIQGEALDERYRTLQGRKADEDALEALVSRWTLDQEAQPIEDRLQAERIPAHVVADTHDMMNDPQLAHLGHFVRLPHPLGGDSIIEASRFQLSDTRVEPTLAAPSFGRDIDHVLGDILGYSEERIASLRATDVLK